MNDQTDSQLLRAYLDQRSEPAFRELVGRHLDLVHSAALRMVRDPHLAQDVSQGVFVALANNAARLTDRATLAGWLHRTAQNIAAQLVRTDVRRRAREQEAAAMNQILATDSDSGWEQIAPYLDAALEELNEPDRDAILLRYFGRKSANEIAAALGISDEAAQKRVTRAVERLRQFFAKRGITIGTAVLVAIISAHSVQAAPAGLAATISTAAFTSGLASSTVVAAAAKTAALTFAQKFLITAGIAVVVGAGIFAVQHQRQIFASAPQKISQTGSSSATASTAQSLEANRPIIREALSDATMFTLDSAPGSLALQPDGKILVGSVLFGAFVDPQTGRLGFYHRTAMRLNPNGTLDRTFLTDVSRNDSSSFMAHLALATNGQILATGSFSAIEGEPRPGIAVLHADGSLDKSMVPWRGLTNSPGRFAVPAGVYPATFLADGTIAFATVSIESSNSNWGPQTVYRLDTNGAWIRPTNDLVGEEFLRPSGMIQTLGEVGFWGAQPVEWTRATPHPLGPMDNTPFAARGTVPTAYDAAKVFRALFEEVPIKLCRYAARLPDGGTILAIQDQPINGISSPGRFMRFDSNWQPDLTFTNSFESDRRGRITLLRQPDGRLLVAGLQGRMNGQDCAGVVRLQADGQTDPTFHCDMTNGLDGRVMDMVLQPDGRIVICGFFSVVDGVDVPHIARLNPDGSLDATFRPPFMTRAQFQQKRLGKRFTLPVVSINPKPASANASAQAASSKTIVITQLTLLGDAAQVQYTGEPERTYILQSKDRLEDTEWTNVSTNQSSAAGNGTLTDPQAGKFPQRFYRIAQQ